MTQSPSSPLTLRVALVAIITSLCACQSSHNEDSARLERLTSALSRSISKSCEPRCEGDILIDNQCNRGDCSSFGLSCITDPLPRCGTVECPRDGAATICLDEHRLLECQDGIFLGAPQSCGAFGAWCSTAGVSETEARCVSALCFDRDTAPYDHVTCSLNYGVRIACYSDNTYETVPCPSGQACSVAGGVTRCTATYSDCAPPERRGETVDLYFCLDERSIGHCYNGNVIDETLCSSDSLCVTSGELTRCLERVCLDPDGDIIEGSTCLNESEVITCDDSGAVLERARCGPRARCEGTQGQSRCVPETSSDQFTLTDDVDLSVESTDVEMSGHDAHIAVELDAEPVDRDSRDLEVSALDSGESEGGSSSLDQERISPQMTFQVSPSVEGSDDQSGCTNYTRVPHLFVLVLLGLISAYRKRKSTHHQTC